MSTNNKGKNGWDVVKEGWTTVDNYASYRDSEGAEGDQGDAPASPCRTEKEEMKRRGNTSSVRQWVSDVQKTMKKGCNSYHFDRDNAVEAEMFAGLAGEVGEVLEAWKKYRLRPVIYNDGPGPIAAKYFAYEEKLIEELGDVMWYVTAIAVDHGLDLGYIMKNNSEKLAKRHKEEEDLLPEGYEWAWVPDLDSPIIPIPEFLDAVSEGDPYYIGAIPRGMTYEFDKDTGEVVGFRKLKRIKIHRHSHVLLTGQTWD